MSSGHLLKAAFELTAAMNKAIDGHLPEKLASIVKLHARLAVGAALIPIPGGDIAAAAANTWAMYIRINEELEIPFAENAVKSLAVGAMTNIGANAAGFLLLASAVKILPGLGTLGGAALMATTIYALTTAAGIVYMRAVASVIRKKSVDQVTEDDLKQATDSLVNDKDSIRSIVAEAKAEYSDEIESRRSDSKHANTDVESTTSPDLGPSLSSVFLAIRGETYGPYSVDDIDEWFTTGRLSANGYFWIWGMVDWASISEWPPNRPAISSDGWADDSQPSSDQ